MLLSKAGADGIASGLLARRLKVPANSLSTQLGLLEFVGLVVKHRDGRSIIYSTNLPVLKSLVQFIAIKCGAGRLRGVKIVG